MDIELLVELVFGLVITLSVILSVGGIVLLYPVSKHLGHYLQAKAEERRALGARSPEELDRLFETTEALRRSLAELEERQAFTERLLSKPTELDP